MDKNLNSTTELLQDKTFKTFSFFFLEKPMNIDEVAKISKISRTTIYSYRKYLKPIGTFTRHKLYFLDIGIIADYFTEKLNLSPEEKQLLTEIMNDPLINNIIRMGNSNWEEVFFKIGVWFMDLRVAMENNIVRFQRRIDKIPIAKEFSDSVIGFINKKEKSLLRSLSSKVIDSDISIMLSIKLFYQWMSVVRSNLRT